MRPRTLEGLDVVAVPTFIADLNDVSAVDVRQYIAPVIVVLDEIALSETEAVAYALTGNADSGNGEVASFVIFALNAILGKDRFVQRLTD